MIRSQIKHYLKNEEMRLALKISGTAFLILLSILLLIIGSSYWYQRSQIIQTFIQEIHSIEGSPFFHDLIEDSQSDSSIIHEMLEGKTRKNERGLEGKKRGPRDVIIFDKQQNIIKNDFLLLTFADIRALFLLPEGQLHFVNIGAQSYMATKFSNEGYTFFLFRDMSMLMEFHIRLAMIAFAGSLGGLLIIFFLARYLAIITIEPMRKHNKELESYSHNVAHELRTPLAVMRSNMELLKMKPDEKYIISSNEEIKNMEHIIESLLFLAKPQQNTQEYQDTDIMSITKECIKKYQEQYQELSIENTEKPIFKKINEELYKRMLANLIENAIKYTSGGEIKVILTKDSISIQNHIEHDISPSELEKLTKSFYQSDTSRHTEGYGLGLALVSKIIEIFGWELQIQSKQNTFKIRVLFR